MCSRLLHYTALHSNQVASRVNRSVEFVERDGLCGGCFLSCDWSHMPSKLPGVRASVREYVFYVFFPDFKKKREFLRFFEMTCQKVIRWKQISSGNIGQCQILTAVKMDIKYFSIF